jgi:CHAD domain-containing protein
MRGRSSAGAAVRQRLETLVRGLDVALETDADGLHRVRVATRRLREVLPLFVPANGSSALVTDLTRVVRTATRALGDVREMDVALMLVDRLATERPDLEPALGLVRTATAGERLGRVERMRRQFDPGGLRSASTSFVERVEQSVDDRRAAALLAQRLQGRIQDLRRAVGEAGLLYAPERLHRIRIATKKLRYALELAGDMRVAATKRLVTELRQTQDRLGLLHDMETVAHLARRTLGGAHDSDTTPLADPILAVIEERIHAQHAEYLAHRDRLLRVIDRAAVACERVRVRRSPRRSSAAGRRRAGPAAG